jgi:hypothetical protein
MSEKYVPLRSEEKERFVELLTKMVKLQRLMRVANYEQQKLVFARASEIIDELVEKFDGERLWCECLLTFGGQYFGQGTECYVGDNMNDDQLRVCLSREVEREELRR